MIYFAIPEGAEHAEAVTAFLEAELEMAGALQAFDTAIAAGNEARRLAVMYRVPFTVRKLSLVSYHPAPRGGG